jgi:hypothetical protein
MRDKDNTFKMDLAIAKFFYYVNILITGNTNNRKLIRELNKNDKLLLNASSSNHYS